MFDIGWSEILVVVIVTILVVGPKELPGLLRTLGKTVGNLRRMAGDFQSQFNQALKEAELDGVRETLEDVRKLNPKNAIKDAVTSQIGSLDDVAGDVKKSVSESNKDINAALNESKADPSSIATAANGAEADLLEDEAEMVDEMALMRAEEAAASSEAIETLEANMAQMQADEPKAASQAATGGTVESGETGETGHVADDAKKAVAKKADE